MPFSSVENDDFYNELGLDFGILNGRLSELNNLRFGLNPFDHLDNDNFINNFAIDADDDCLNLCTGHCLGYIDTDQLDSSLQVQNGEGKLGSIMHINARSLIANVDLLYANLRLLKNKISCICVSREHGRRHRRSHLLAYLDMTVFAGRVRLDAAENWPYILTLISRLLL